MLMTPGIVRILSSWTTIGCWCWRTSPGEGSANLLERTGGLCFLGTVMRYSSNPRSLNILRLLSPLVLLMLQAGCTTFNHDWKQAASKPAPTDDIQGRWQGVWKSEVTGHTDQLRCVVTQESDGNYRARFHAKYHKVLSFGYTVPLKAEPVAGNDRKFKGEADLGWLA